MTRDERAVAGVTFGLVFLFLSGLVIFGAVYQGNDADASHKIECSCTVSP